MTTYRAGQILGHLLSLGISAAIFTFGAASLASGHAVYVPRPPTRDRLAAVPPFGG